MPTGLFTLSQVNQAIRQGAWTGFIPPTWVEYLVVAGGGGGGGQAGAGGGAGGLLSGVVTIAANTSYTVTVGAGGSGGSNAAGSGVNSLFGSISATGGGGGNGYSSGPNAVSGGSGAGGNLASGDTAGFGGQGVAGQGNRGGTSGTRNGEAVGAGGGGAGTVGLDTVPVSGVAGNGGAGIASAISGVVIAYAGGGGGGGTGGTAGSGGIGGGGSGQVGAGGTAGGAGGGNTGGGGGAGSFGAGVGGAGGSGVVIVRYPGTVQYFTGGTLSYANGYVIHTFNASGTFAPTTPTPYIVEDYQISRSLRFNSADSAYLERTPASAGNRRTYTFSTWVKRSQLNSGNAMLATVSGSAFNYFSFGTATGDWLTFAYFDGASDIFGVNTSSTSLFRDVSAWYHIVLSVDTTQATAANRVKIYVNSVEQTLGGTYPTQNYDTPINNTIPNFIGGATGSYTAYLADQYMTEVNFIDGQALTPSSFGYYNFNTGVWSPTRYVGVYGTNGFYLNFSDNSNTTAATLGADYSGNGNNWTPNNFSVSAGAGNDSLVDVPTNWGVDTGVGGSVRGNYCTLNPLTTVGGTYTQGNLRYTGLGAFGSFRRSNATISRSDGKWYWEVTLGNAPFSPRSNGSEWNAFGFGVSTAFNSTTVPSSVTDAVILCDNGWYKNFSGAFTDGGTGFSSGDVLSVAVDLDANTFTFRRNNTSLVTGTIGGTAGRDLVPIILSYDGQYGVMDCNFGQRPFAYTAPSGFKALNTQNLPTPTIGATPATQAGKFFNPVLWTGNGSSQTISTVGFQADLVWIKSRSAAYSPQLQDVLRGFNSALSTNDTAAEYSGSANYGYVDSLTSSGYTVLGGTLGPQHTNENGVSYVGWNWKANGTGVTNTAGTITSTVSANTTSGFSVVTYTGTGSNATVGHGLGAAPRMVIVRQRNAAGSWLVYHNSIGATQYLVLNTTGAAQTGSTFWNNTAPSSTVFSVGNDGNVNGSGGTYVAYAFAEVPGYSKFGSYTGNGSSDGPFCFTGMRPAYVMYKKAGGPDGDWVVLDVKRDPTNVTARYLAPNASQAESNDPPFIDILSNGFKMRRASGGSNENGVLYIFAAFAEVPQKFALAR